MGQLLNPASLAPRPPRNGGLFVGRLVAENGLGTLLEALDLFPGARVDVIGSGPEERRLAVHPRVRLLGRVGPSEVQERMRRAAYLVLPSLSYEPLPRPLIEAYANALPVIARRLAWAEAFPEKMRQMGECARADYDARFVADWSHQKLFGERRRAARAS